MDPTNARRPGPRSITATQLRSMWRSVSKDRGWRHPDDWWTPAVDAVTESIVADGPVVECIQRLGIARARAGVSMGETLDDVTALAGLVRSLQSHPAHRFASARRAFEVVELVRAVAIGWADVADGRIGSPVARVSSGMLPDTGYLVHRLREVALESEHAGERLGQRYALVVAALPAADVSGADGAQCDAGTSEAADVPDAAGLKDRMAGWDRTWQMSQLADDLRTVFAAGEPIVSCGSCTALVLVRRDPSPSIAVAALRGLLEEHRSADAPPIGIWVERLPNDLCHAQQLLDDLRR